MRVVVNENVSAEASQAPWTGLLNRRGLQVKLAVDRAPAETVEEVIAAVTAPLEVANCRGKRRVAAGSNDMNELSLNDLSLYDDANPIARFLSDTRCLRVVSQCIVRMVDGVAVAHELLVRGPRGDLESPNVLFALASSANSLITFDLNCLRATMAMRARVPFATRCHVNVDPATLIGTPIRTVLDIVGDEHGPDELCIELSEQQLVGSPMRLRDARMALRAQGIGVALDRVGFGHSSLEALIVLEPDIVKVDRRLVQGVSRDAGKVRALRRLACVVQGLGAEVIAEGVESLSDIGALRRIGIELGQGYFWDTPSEIVASSPTNAGRAL
jgi:EAL domain-containing protein (putative c-di-GMP-specific phosphodiesterase class I)